MSELKEKLYGDTKLMLSLFVEGVNFDSGVFNALIERNNAYAKAVDCTWDKELITKDNYILPSQYTLENGLTVPLISDKSSRYKISEESGDLVLSHNDTLLSKLTFPEPPQWLKKSTSDGSLMRNIGFDSSAGSSDKSILIPYSTECSVKDKGQTCLFCTYNGKKGLKSGEEKTPWKYPHQIAETVKAAYDEGFSHLTITGGFIAERREIDYYIDVAEAIQSALGTENFNGTACIGAPLDLSIIDKYKEAGYSSIAFNTEVWGADYFGIYCPGKVSECGGYDHWIKALEHAVQVFGKGAVRSNFVCGLQPKEPLLEGLDYLTSIGVVTVASPWIPALGSPLEGHRSPTVDWHWDIQLKNYQLLRKYGRTYQEVFNTTPARNISHVLYQIDDETLPIFGK